MDRKSIAILAVSFLVIVAGFPLINRIFPPQPIPPELLTNSATTGTNQLATGNGATNVVRSTNGVPLSVTNAAPVIKPAKEELLTLENEDARYIFTSAGGGIKHVELKNYKAYVGCRLPPGANTNALATLNHRAPRPSFALLGGEALEGDGSYALSKTGPNGVRAEKVLPNGLRLVKDFQLRTNYQFGVTIRIENRGAQAIRIPNYQIVLGTSTPIGSHDESMNLGLEWYNGSSLEKINDTWFQNKTLGCFAGTPRTEYVGGASNVVWAAVNNQFFTIIAQPTAPGELVHGLRVNLPPPTVAELANDPLSFRSPFGFETGFRYEAQSIPAEQGLERVFNVFAGPKEYNTLSRLPNDQDHVMGFGGFFGFFAKALLLSMNGLHKFGLSYGLAIIAITTIIKILFWPLTKASTASMKRMSALQPQMKAIQEKYKEDPAKMNAKVMEFMKENKVSPLGGCLPMLLQIPVFFGFYTMLQSAIELRGAHFLWSCDLSKPDTLFMIPGLDMPFNPLPLLMGVTMLWQASLTPPSPGMDPAQQKIMKYMPLMMLFFFYNMSSGLTLYWTTQNLLSIAQMKLTKDKPNDSKPALAGPGLPPKKRK